MSGKIDQSTSLESLRQTQVTSEMEDIMSVISHYMAIPLFLVFWIADLIYAPQFKVEFLFLRLLIIPICLMTNWLLKKTANSFQSKQLIVAFYAVSLAAIINTMIFLIPDPETKYYAGLNLVAVGCLSFIPYTLSAYIFSSLGIYLPYFLITLSKSNSVSEYSGILTNAFFIIGTVVISFVIRFFNEKLRLKQIQAQFNLEEELRLREEIIKRKTAEATKLNQLSAQFSPQVVEAIKNGQINLDESMKRSRICAIFIDIVNSTERVVKLDQAKVQITLARFLDTVLTVFLKYDLTIDKFHGDGVLAFANSPVTRQDFIERTCMAAIEAREMLQRDRDFYILNWKTEMQVRVGISVGYANVGFYGDKKYFKTFSAIGAPLPFASRLTSIAQPNQILIDSDIADCLSGQNFSTKIVGERILKGFDDDTNIVHELVDQIKENTSGQNKKCPNHPDSVLYLDTNDKGHFVFKCRECGFSETDIASDYFGKQAV